MQTQKQKTNSAFGCGNSTLRIEAAKRIGSGHGIEPSAEMIAHVPHNAEAQTVTEHVSIGSADQMPLANAWFDVVSCTMVLHHLPTTRQTAASRKRIAGFGRKVALAS